MAAEIIATGGVHNLRLPVSKRTGQWVVAKRGNADYVIYHAPLEADGSARLEPRSIPAYACLELLGTDWRRIAPRATLGYRDALRALSLIAERFQRFDRDTQLAELRDYLTGGKP